MGNQTSNISSNIPTVQTPEPNKKLVQILEQVSTEKEDKEEMEIITKMSKISHDIMLEYINLHLDKDFCNNLAIIYANKMEKFKIPLKEIHNKLSDNTIDNDLIMVYRAGNKDDEKFRVGDEIKVGLEDLFWNKYIKFDPKAFDNINLLDKSINPKDLF
jgi:hypothetical protein